MWGIVIALVSGALMSLQGIFNTEVTKQTSIWVSAGWVHCSDYLHSVLVFF
jgi:transporter family-2 protein